MEALVYGCDELVLLGHLPDEGLAKTAIAARLGMDRKTVSRWIAGGMVDTVEELERPPRVCIGRPTRLAPYQAFIHERTTYRELSAVCLFDECRAAGLPGSYTQLNSSSVACAPGLSRSRSCASRSPPRGTSSRRMSPRVSSRGGSAGR